MLFRSIALCAAQFAAYSTFIFFLTWFPTYLATVRHMAWIKMGFLASLPYVAGFFGILLGLVAGYGPRWLDSLLILCFDSVTSLPMIMFALAVITVLGPSTTTLILVIILVSIPGYARFIRAQTLSLSRSDFITAEQAMNASNTRIILLHLLPNVVGQILVVLSMDIPVVIMLEIGRAHV